MKKLNWWAKNKEGKQGPFTTEVGAWEVLLKDFTIDPDEYCIVWPVFTDDTVEEKIEGLEDNSIFPVAILQVII